MASNAAGIFFLRLRAARLSPCAVGVEERSAGSFRRNDMQKIKNKNKARILLLRPCLRFPKHNQNDIHTHAQQQGVFHPPGTRKHT